LDALTHQVVEVGIARLQQAPLLVALMVGGDEPREDRQAAPPDNEVVITSTVRLSAELQDTQPPPLGAVLGRQLLQRHDAVHDALQLQVGRLGGFIIEQEDGALAADEELLEGEDLPTVTKGILGQKPHFGKRVNDDSGRLAPLDLGQDRLGRQPQLDF